MSQTELKIKPLTAPPVECSCGRWYADQAGVNACQQHGHYSRKWSPHGEYQATATIGLDVTVHCVECGEQLHFAMTAEDSGGIKIGLPRHACQVDAPEALTVGVDAVALEDVI